MKKAMIFGLILVIGMASISMVSAGDVSIGGVDFNIPQGFEENPIYTAVDEMDENGVINNVMAFEKGDDVIYICVADPVSVEWDLDSISDLGDKPETINGVEGYTYDSGWVEGYESATIYGFIYPENGDAVMVLTTDESLLEDVIVK